MKLGDFLKNLATKIGLQNEQALVDLLARPELSDVDVNDAIANPIVRDLMSLDGAKNNSMVKNHFNALALNGVDTEILNSVTELGLDEDTVTKFKNEKNTFAKIGYLKEQFKALQAKKVETNDPVKKAEYERQIQELNTSIAKMRDDFKTEKATLTATHQSEMVNFIKKNSLVARPYANKDLKAEVNVRIAETLVDDELSRVGAILIRDGNILKLKQKANPDLDYYQDNKPIAYDDFVNKVLADNKLLQVSDPKPPVPPVPPVRAPFTPIPGQQTVDTSKLNAAVQSSMADLQNNQ